MATKKCCDIYGTTKDVATYRVTIGLKAIDPSAAPIVVLSRDIDLGPRALLRLTKFIERGTTRPEAKTK